MEEISKFAVIRWWRSVLPICCSFCQQADPPFEVKKELCLINKSIVEVIIVDLLFHLEDVKGCTHARALSLSSPLYQDENQAVIEQDKKLVTIKTLKRFSLVVGWIVLGASSYMVTNIEFLALDRSTLHGMPYLDVQTWLAIKMEVYNFHLLAIPLFDSYTAEKHIQCCFQVLGCPICTLVSINWWCLLHDR